MADIDVSYDPISINSGPVTVDVTGLNDINATLSIPKPIETDTTLKLLAPDTIKTDGHLESTSTLNSKSSVDTNSAIDLRPVAIDQCLRLSLAPLPATRICFPNRQRIALSVFGVEVFGVTLDGEAQVLVGEPQRQTHVIAGEATTPRKGEASKVHVATRGGPPLKIRLGG